MSSRTIFFVPVLLVAALALGVLPPATAQAAPAPPFALVQVPSLNVRALPSTNAPVVGQVANSERVTILGRNGDGTWLRVETAAGLSGWVFAELAQPSVPMAALNVYAAGGAVSAQSVAQSVAPAESPAVAQAPAAPVAAQNQVAVHQPPAAAPVASAAGPAPNSDPAAPRPGASAPVEAAAPPAEESPTALQPVCLPNRLRRIALGGRPQAITAIEDRLYVALANVNSLIVVDSGQDMMLGSSRTTAKRIGSVSANDDALYVADTESERLIVTTRYGAVKSAIPLPAAPGAVAATDGRVFVLHPQIGAVSVVDLSSASVLTTLSIGAEPRQVVVIAGRAFIGHAAGFLSIVDGFGRRQEQLHLPVNDVVGMAANYETGMLYVASAADYQVLAVDTETWTLGNVWELDQPPSSLVYNDITDHLYVLDRTSQFLTVLSGSLPEQVGAVRVSDEPARDGGSSLAMVQSKLYVMHPGNDDLDVWLDRSCQAEIVAVPEVAEQKHVRTDLAPKRVQARIGILWPHGGVNPQEASYANLTATLLRDDGAAPACGWEPAVTLWAATGAGPMEQISTGRRRMMTEDGVTFPVYDFNDVDVRVTRDLKLPMHFSVRVENVEVAQNVWTHSATGQYVPTVRPELDGLVNRPAGALDARLWVEEGPDGPQIYGILMRAETMLGLAPSAAIPTPQLRWSLDNGTTEPELVVGKAETRQDDGFVYSVWRFPGVNPDDFLRDAAQVRFWVEMPETEVYSSVLAWGEDIRTLGARLPVPVIGCEQGEAVASR